MPEKLARDLILSYSCEGDVILDPYGGSFTTAKMAFDLKRFCVTCELNDEYYNFISILSDNMDIYNNQSDIIKKLFLDKKKPVGKLLGQIKLF